MNKYFEAVSKFQRSFGQGVGSVPTLISSDKAKLRFELMKEENEEYLEAVEAGDIVEVADALVDQLYILCGTILEHGLQYKMEAVFDEVQRSNMSKLDEAGLPIINGENGVFDETRALGKVLKSYNYSPPDLKSIVLEP